MNSDLTWPSSGVFYLPSIKRVPVPLELLCEPWSELCPTYDITKRPDFSLLVHRPRFRFEISSRMVSYSVGGYLTDREYERSSSLVLPSKCHSIVSVLSVYDMYGLDVACSFLKYNRDRVVTEAHSTWMSLYILGSLAAIDESYNEWYCTPELDCLCSMLLLRLIQLDYCQPRLTQELVPTDSSSCPFPPEVVALITGNGTLCKSVYEQVKLLRAVLPTLADLEADHLDLCTYVLEDGSYVVQDECTPLARYYLHLSPIKLTGEYRMVCKTLPCDAVRASQASMRENDGAFILTGLRARAFSIRDRLRWMKHRGCTNRVAVLRQFLEEKLASFSEVTEENKTEACVWFTQLMNDIYHRDVPEEGEFIIPDLESLGACLRGIMRKEIYLECK